MRVERQRSTGPVDDDHRHSDVVLSRILEQLVLQLRHPVRQRRVDEAVNDELRLSICSEVRAVDALLVLGDQHLSIVGILLGVQDELRVDDVARQWKDVEWPMYQVIPFAGDVQAANFTVAARLVLNWRKRNF